jgi:hypothetical protein
MPFLPYTNVPATNTLCVTLFHIVEQEFVSICAGNTKLCWFEVLSLCVNEDSGLLGCDAE